MHVYINVKKHETVCSRIKAGWHSISRMYSTYALDKDFSMSMTYVLMNLSLNEGVPSTHIGPRLGVESRSLTRILKQMEDEGIIRKEQGDEDKRQVMIYLTDKGKVLKKQAKKIVKSFNEKIEEHIPEEKLATFMEVLNEINIISETNHLTT